MRDKLEFHSFLRAYEHFEDMVFCTAVDWVNEHYPSKFKDVYYVINIFKLR